MQALSLKQLFIIIIIIANTVMETMWRDYAETALQLYRHLGFRLHHTVLNGGTNSLSKPQQLDRKN